MQHLLGADPGPLSTALQHDTHSRTQLFGVGDRIQAKDAYRTSLRAAETLAGLDRRGLAGAIGAQNRCDRTGLYRQIDVIDGHHIAVPHVQAADVYGGGWGPDAGLTSTHAGSVQRAVTGPGVRT